MLISKYRAILKAKMIDGLYLPFSSEPIVCLDTSSSVAKSSCLMPFDFRISSNLFFNNINLLTESVLYIYKISQNESNVKCTFHKVNSYYFFCRYNILFKIRKENRNKSARVQSIKDIALLPPYIF